MFPGNRYGPQPVAARPPPDNEQQWLGDFHPDGLPEDDDPLLQRRLQQVVQDHENAHNVLRELADVAEQHPRKRSDARKKMDLLLERQGSAQHAIALAEKEIKSLKKQLEHNIAQKERLDKEVLDASKELCDELLKEKSFWNQMYFHLLEFHNRTGHLRVPWKKEEKEKDPLLGKLGPWLVAQRKNYRRKFDDPERLEPWKIVALEKLDIEWEPFRTHWMNRFEDLKKFKEEQGHTRVPYCSGRKRKREGGEASEKIVYDSLGVWVKRQRHQYKMFQAGVKEKAGDMTEDKVKLLDSIDFEWALRSQSDRETWNERYDELKNFKEENGHVRVPDKDKQLFGWVKTMRGLMAKFADGAGSPLTQEQFDLLKKLDLDPSSLRETKFEERMADLMEFKKTHGHCVVPSSYPLNPKLSNWVMTQKRQYKLLKDGKKSQLTEEKVKFLQEAGFEFEVTKERKSQTLKKLTKSWEEFYAELEQHKQKIGNVNEITQKKRLQLREWCEEQRVQAARLKWGKESDITDEQINKLTDLGFEWDTVNSPSKGWDDFYGELLIQFIKKKSWDFLSEPGDIKDWAEKQRGEYRKFVHDIPSLLIADQVQKLHAVNFPWQVKYNSKQTAKSWEEMFGELLAFKIKHGHINVDHNNFELYNWKARQREEQEKIQKKSAKKRSAIIEERVRKLTDIGFDWDGPRITLGKGNRGNMDVPLPMMTAQIPLAMPAFAVVPWPNAFPGPAPMTTVATAPAPTSVYPVVQNQAQNSKDLANEAAQVVANLNARNKEAPSKVAGRQEQKSTRTDETTEPWA